MKTEKSPSALLFPLPVVLVTSNDRNRNSNIITLAWVGVACSVPPLIGISIRPHRYSNKLISESKEFVVNIPTAKMLRSVDICGMMSGQEVDKFAITELTAEPASKVKPPLIKECIINQECVLMSKYSFGSHDLFLGEVVKTHVDSRIIDEEGHIDYKMANPLVYLPEEYWTIGDNVGKFGLSKISDE